MCKESGEGGRRAHCDAVIHWTWRHPDVTALWRLTSWRKCVALERFGCCGDGASPCLRRSPRTSDLSFFCSYWLTIPFRGESKLIFFFKWELRRWWVIGVVKEVPYDRKQKILWFYFFVFSAFHPFPHFFFLNSWSVLMCPILIKKIYLFTWMAGLQGWRERSIFYWPV